MAGVRRRVLTVAQHLSLYWSSPRSCARQPGRRPRRRSHGITTWLSSARPSDPRYED
jgi:hypothetical protein